MSIAIVWFRQDLRCNDNPALTKACNNHSVVIPLYINDGHSGVLGRAQRWWLHHSLIALDKNLKNKKLSLCLRSGNALKILKKLISEYNVDAVYWNRCYEPEAIKRDILIKENLTNQGINVISSNGSLLIEPWHVKNKTGDFFKVFTPFWRHCLQNLNIPSPEVITRCPASIEINSDSLSDWRLLPQNPNWALDFKNYWTPGEAGAHENLENFLSQNLAEYKESRNIPAKNSTSRLSPHLHFGEISPWQIWRTIEEKKLDNHYDLISLEHFLSEMGWREFSYHLLYHFPTLPTANFKAGFDRFPWQLDEAILKRWQKGETGFPIVDAGMRELWQTGYMHNRVRMIVASFLTKDLSIDWRLGAAWFLDTLLDADLANNSASWQWVAGCGVDAAPYFRIFNPILQGEKFDPEGEYVRRWVPELTNIPTKWIHKPWLAPKSDIQLFESYPSPIVDHNEARKKALLNYRKMNE